MTARKNSAGRGRKTRVVAAVTLSLTAGALLLATELPSGISMGAGASSALAELVARSPGMRIGGVSLKAKTRRAQFSPAAPAGPGSEAAPGNALASVLGTAVGPEGPVPGIGAIGPGDFPRDFTAPGVPGEVSGPGSPASGPPSGSGGGVGIPVGGFPIFGGGGGGGVIGGGTGGGPPILPPPPPVIPGIPEPSAWLMLIIGFGLIGGSMRREWRVRIA